MRKAFLWRANDIITRRSESYSMDIGKQTMPQTEYPNITLDEKTIAYRIGLMLWYLPGLPLKDIQTERHLYHCMALTANALSFFWSRWNLLSGYDKLIMQFREKVPGHQESPLQVRAWPAKKWVVHCPNIYFNVYCGYNPGN